MGDDRKKLAEELRSDVEAGTCGIVGTVTALHQRVNATLSLLDAQAVHITRLEDAIKTHRTQKADDRCIEDDDRLYEALGDGIKCDRRVGDKGAMLANCERFIAHRCESGGWLSYVELEQKITRLEDAMREAEKRLATASVAYMPYRYYTETSRILHTALEGE